MAKSRKQRRASRKDRKQRRTQRRNRKQQGGSSPVGVYNLGLKSDAQGADYLKYHTAQHGGMAPIDAATRLIDDPSMLESARVAPLDAALKAIENIRDPGQAGGARKRRASRKSGKSRKGRKGAKGSKSKRASRKQRKSHRSTRRRQGGGAFNPELLGSATGPHMLLSPAMTARAGLNQDWSNLSDYAPKLR